ncbi:MAG: YggS family pyridoxal phosphate-dependent enzyme [Proteobacteria bacterium]|nr:YggS family pyridoxal phosphate-dependent enzyme [Pseudomonadota bacterium]
MNVAENYKKIRKEIPEQVSIVVAAKTRTATELSEIIDAGATDIGENYVQEAKSAYEQLGEKANRVRWHLIGSLQKNKINKALPIFDIIQTIGDYEIAENIDKKVERAGKKIVPVCIEINIGSEFTKYGVKPEFKSIEELIRKISDNLKYLKIVGLMTMGPRVGDPEDSREYFRKTKEIFERIKTLSLPRVEMKILSMGMSNSYEVAIQEGSNLVRIGTSIFGERKY